MSADKATLQIIYDLALQARAELRALRPMAPLETRRKIATIANLAFVKGKAAPVEELEASYPIVLYFEKKQDAAEFVGIIREAKPNLVARQL